MKKFKSRPIRFIKLYSEKDWHIKIYSISDTKEFVHEAYINNALPNLPEWLALSNYTNYQNYKVATLIFHECKEGCFAILNWWVDDNMLQHYVYVCPDINSEYTVFSSNGIVTCVWELQVLWHERNAWIKHVLEPGNLINLNQCRLVKQKTLEKFKIPYFCIAQNNV
jgi:hypothetical protein